MPILNKQPFIIFSSTNPNTHTQPEQYPHTIACEIVPFIFSLKTHKRVHKLTPKQHTQTPDVDYTSYQLLSIPWTHETCALCISYFVFEHFIQTPKIHALLCTRSYRLLRNPHYNLFECRSKDAKHERRFVPIWFNLEKRVKHCIWVESILIDSLKKKKWRKKEEGNDDVKEKEKNYSLK